MPDIWCDREKVEANIEVQGDSEYSFMGGDQRLTVKSMNIETLNWPNLERPS
jgi:hypothetical protein